MRFNDEMTRQTFGCGWAPIPPERLRPFVKVPTPAGYEPTRDAEGVEIDRECPGYTTGLPEVLEAAHARHWKHDLPMWARGEPTRLLMLGVQILDGAYNELTDKKMMPAEKGGLG